MEKKRETSGQGGKRKHLDEGGMEMESKVLVKSKKPKCQDEGGTNLEFEEPSKAQKRIPQKQWDVELQSKQQGKNQTQKPQAEGSSQRKPLEKAKGLQEQVIPEKTSADGGKVHKRAYCMGVDNEYNHQKEKEYQWLL